MRKTITNKAKRAAVLAAVNDPKNAGLSTRELAELLRVSHTYIANARRGALSTRAAQLPVTLKEFAAAVLDAARSCEDGCFGTDKVFISRIQNRMGVSVEQAAEFKARLIECAQAGHLTLARADLVGAMNPADVTASCTQHLNATFHFVRL